MVVAACAWAGGPKGPTIGKALQDLMASGDQVSIALVGTAESEGVGVAGYSGTDSGSSSVLSSSGTVSRGAGVSSSSGTVSQSAAAPTTITLIKLKGFDVEKWKQSVCRESLSSMEQWLLSQYSGRKNFVLIDRFATEQALATLHASSATAITPEIRSALAQQLGATHIFYIHEKFDETDGALYRKITETRDLRLLDAKTGAVLAAKTEKFVIRRPY